MDKIDVINNFGKILMISIFVYLTYTKITNIQNNNKIKILEMVVLDIIIAYVYLWMIIYISPIFVLPIIVMLWSLSIIKIEKQKFNYCVFTTIISFILVYLIYFISTLISGIALKLLISNIDYKSPISLLTIPIIMCLICYFILKAKRLKNGLNFLKNEQKINEFGKFINSLLLLTIMIFGLLQDSESVLLNTILVIVAIIAFNCMIIWLQTQITKHYKKHMKDRTIEIQKTEIDEQVKLIEEIKEENLRLATAVHKYNHRLSALELAMKEAISNNLNTEFANELSVILKETDEISKSFSKESNVVKNNLPLTNVPGVDNMFKYMQEEAIKSNINFDLKINESIHDLLENIIPKDKFETLLGDHLRDAIIAVNASNSSYKSILTTLGMVENCYEFSIYDTGIEFEINTLLKLGKEQVTTHKDTGGSGIGFITTFETLKATKASLIIEEYNPKTTNYTKSVNIRFDGKGEYRIYSYRAEDIKNGNKEKRIIIKNIE